MLLFFKLLSQFSYGIYFYHCVYVTIIGIQCKELCKTHDKCKTRDKFDFVVPLRFWIEISAV
jgi:hypothetical protein